MVTSSASFTEYPEAVENKLYESVNARKNSLKKEGGLGPPDLCHLTKQQEKPPSILRSAPQLPSVIGTYHHVFGMDCRTPAGVAAYFTNTVNNQQTKDKMHHNSSKGVWKIQSATFCTYNAFTGLDVRVEVTFPGTVNAYVLDQENNKYSCDERMWQEVCVCSVLRYLNKPPEFDMQLDAMCILSSLETSDGREGFLNAAKEVFWDGKLLGTDSLNARVSNLNNILTRSIKKFFFQGSAYLKCIDFFNEFVDEDPELNVVIAECYHYINITSKGISLLAYTLLSFEVPPPSIVLDQSKLLHETGDNKNALKLAKSAVSLAPAQACSWLNLATMYIHNKDYDMALVALNVTPMSHGQSYQVPQMPEPERLENNNEIIRDLIEEEEQGDATLLSLPANGLKGTFLEAYKVLTLLLQDISWDDMLKARSRVFLMEEEELKGNGGLSNSEITNSVSETIIDYDGNSNNSSSIDNENTNNNNKNPNNCNDDKSQTNPEGINNKPDFTIHKKELTQNNNEEIEIGFYDNCSDDHRTRKKLPGGKRLLERWLDQLFTALYQDLMYSVIWKAQDKQNSSTERSVGDFFRYSELLNRLNRKEEAFMTLQRCISTGFCLRAHLALLNTYSTDGFVEESLSIINSVEKFYLSNPGLCIPMDLSNAIHRLVSKHGLSMFRQLGGTERGYCLTVRNSIKNVINWKVNGYDR